MEGKEKMKRKKKHLIIQWVLYFATLAWVALVALLGSFDGHKGFGMMVITILLGFPTLLVAHNYYLKRAP